ncbi:WxL protein host-binding domain-containing protein [Lacticaseibacillus sp. GG6-2]
MSRFLLLLGLVAGFLLPATPVNAAGAEFSVAANQPSGYFQFTLAPGATKALPITINNTAAKARNFTVQMVPASTDSNGQLLYTAKANLTKAGKPTLTAWTSKSMHVTVAAHGTKQVALTLAVPPAAKSGEKLGAINVTDQPEFAAKRQSSIQNRFTLATPVHLTVTKALATRPYLTLDHAKLEAAKATISANLASHTARLFGKISMHTTLENAAGKTVLAAKLQDAQMAPGAIMPLRLPVGTHKLHPGTYTLRVRLNSGTQHYDLHQPLTITGTQARAVPGTRPTVQAVLPWWVYALIAAVIALAAAVIVLLFKRRKQS